VIEVADVFRRFADAYLAAHGAAVLPSHRRAIADILACRTAALGGHLWQCDHCSLDVYSYHSCNNRSCSKCHTDDTERWLQARKLEMLPCHYFHVTVTVPQELREILRANQRDGYALLMKAAAHSIIDIARDPHFIGGTPGVLAVLHTWTQQLHYHPHVHCLVTGGGVSTAAVPCWHPARPSFLAPETAIAKLVCGKLKAWFAQKHPGLIIPASAWRIPWVVRITPWGEGEEAVLRYLARYVFRIAITNSRIVSLDEHTVSFRYNHRQSNRWRICTLHGQEFMRRFLQHVLPKGLHKVRYFGLWHPSKRPLASKARLLLHMQRAQNVVRPSVGAHTGSCNLDHSSPSTPDPRICPRCGLGHLILVRQLLPKQPQGP